MAKKKDNQKPPPSFGNVGGKPIERTIGMSLLVDAKNYLVSARILHKKHLNTLYVPIYFLSLRSIELGFKSILKFKESVSIDELKHKYKHNLTMLMQQCIDCKYISLSKQEIDIINDINKYYYDKHFEYTQLIDKELYAPQCYISISEKIIKQANEITQEVGTKRFP